MTLKMTKQTFHNLEKMKHLGKADLHIHSMHSDGRPTITEILDYVEKKTNLDVIAITDHDTMDGAFEAAELMKTGKYHFDLILGEEVSSKEGHILSLFLTKPIKPGMSAHETIAEVHRQGGVAIAAHPFEHLRYRLSSGLTMDGVGLITLLQERSHWNGVETVNATPTLHDENIRAAFINRTMMFKAETGSSDAHIVEVIGKGYTLFEGDTAADFRHALAHHQTQAMNAKWNFHAFARYAFFFIPVWIRLLFFTLIHGKTRKKVDIVNVPDDFRVEDKNKY